MHRSQASWALYGTQGISLKQSAFRHRESQDIGLMKPATYYNGSLPRGRKAKAEANRQAVLNGELSGLFGKSLPTFESEFARLIGCHHGIAVTSGTTALHLAVAACHFPPGSEILLSASTNIATALAIVHNNLIPVPVDSEPQSWNLNPDLIEGSITPKTRAIMPVHLFGYPARMDKICRIAEKYKLVVIEDCAEAHGATWQGKMAGSWGDMGCLVFWLTRS